MISDIYFIADTHFGHSNMLNFEPRPYETIEEMNESLIRNWNNTVKPQDTIYVLGDFSFGTPGFIREVASQLNGDKILVMGNHDRRKTVTFWKDAGFIEVHKEPIMYNQNIILSHEPVMKLSHGGEEDVDFINSGFFNLHGHLHSRSKLDKEFYKCVSVENINYKPIHIDEIMKGRICWKYYL